MKKLIFFIFLLCTPFLVEAKNLHVLGLGDSITSGYGVEEGYLDIVCNTLEKQEENVICTNLSINGLTSTKLRKQIETEEVIAEIKKADYIFMSVGGNDFLKEIARYYRKYRIEIDKINLVEPNQVFQNNIKELYQTLHTHNKDALIFVVPLYDPYYMVFDKIPSLRDTFDQIKEEFTKISRKYPYIRFPDTLGEEIENVQYLNTSFSNLDPHPNTEGHQLIADRLLEEIPRGDRNQAFLYVGIFLVFVGISILGIFLFYKHHTHKKNKELV